MASMAGVGRIPIDTVSSVDTGLRAAKVARALAGIAGQPYQGVTLGEMTIEHAEINGEPGAFMMSGGRVVAAGTFTVVGGRIAAIQLVANPEKLDAISARRTLRL